MNDERGLDFEVMRTGIPNLDVVLGGGIPVGSFNLLAGGPGTGKTILSQQMMYTNATPERPALHFTVLGEPVAKLLRYQRRFSFFDADKLNTAIRYIDIGDVIRKEGLERGLEAIVSRVERFAPALVVVDSIRAVREITRGQAEYGLRSFTNDLAQVAVVWNATSILIGEFEETELRAGPEFTMADGIIWMTMEQVANSVVRKLQVVKSRGMDPVLGLHSFRIDRGGVYVYPRMAPVVQESGRRLEDRCSFGVPGLDRMTEGGIPRGDACIVAGPSGTGKSVLGIQFLGAGIRNGESAVALTFEETVGAYREKARGLGLDFARWEQEGKLSLLYHRPMDLTVDEIIDETVREVTRLGATRLVIDSISGFELSRAPADRTDFREALYRTVVQFTSHGVTVLMTTEVPEVFGELRFSTHAISFVADDIILLSYTEMESELRKVLTVVKMRYSAHDKELRQFQITSSGAQVGAPFREYTGLLSGAPTLVAVMGPQPFAPGLEPRESALVHALFGLGTATADEVAKEMGLDKAEVERTLRGLVGGGYVVREEKDGQSTYHVSMVSWAPSVRRAPRRGGGQGGQGRVEG